MGALPGRAAVGPANGNSRWRRWLGSASAAVNCPAAIPNPGPRKSRADGSMPRTRSPGIFSRQPNSGRRCLRCRAGCGGKPPCPCTARRGRAATGDSPRRRFPPGRATPGRADDLIPSRQIAGSGAWAVAAKWTATGDRLRALSALILASVPTFSGMFCADGKKH